MPTTLGETSPLPYQASGITPNPKPGDAMEHRRMAISRRGKTDGLLFSRHAEARATKLVAAKDWLNRS